MEKGTIGLSKVITAICFVSLSIMLAPQANAALISTVSQTRTTSAYLDFQTINGDKAGDSKNGSATNFGVFNSTVTANTIATTNYCRRTGCYLMEAGSGTATGSQNSEIAASSILANGSASWNVSSGWLVAVFSSGGASSNFGVTFDLTQDATFSLTGSLSNYLLYSSTSNLGSPNGQATIGLMGTSSIAYHLLDSRVSSLGSLSFSDTGQLRAGRYTLSAAATSGGSDYNMTNNGNSSYSFQLTLTPTPVPLPGALWLLISGISLISAAGLRRKTTVASSVSGT